MKKYTIFTLVCFLSFVGYVFADADYTYHINSLDTVAWDTGGRVNYNCTGISNDHSTLTGIPSSTGYTVKHDKMDPSATAGYVDVVCTWDRNVELGEVSGGTETHRIYYSKYDEPDVFTDGGSTEDNPVGGDHIEVEGGYTDFFIDVQLTEDMNQVDLGTESNVSSQHKIAQITSAPVKTRGPEYIDVTGCSVGSSNCVVKATSLAYDDGLSDDSFYSEFEFKYVDINGNNINAYVRVTINTFDAARAYPGGLGVCGFSGDWVERNYVGEDGKAYHFYQSHQGVDAQLPSCDSSLNNTEVPVVFKGWTGNHTTDDYLYAVGECSSAYPVGTTIQTSFNYSACYEVDTVVQLAVSQGKVTDNSWTATSMGYYKNIGGSTGSVTLPDLEFTGFSKDLKLLYWEDEDGNRHDPNTTLNNVRAGQIFRAVTESTTVERDTHKTILVNQTALFTVPDMTTCRLHNATDEYVDVQTSGSDVDCIVTGKKVTPDGAYGLVDVELNDGSVITYSFTVTNNTGLSQDGDNGFIINTTPNVVVGENDYASLNNFDSNICESFTIYPVAGSGSSPETVVGSASGTVLHSTLYEVTPNCEGSGDYAAVCLDPGRVGPEGSGITYYKTSDITPESEMGKVLSYVIKNYDFSSFGDAGSEDRIASHVALRIVGIMNLAGSGSEADVVYYSHYIPYVNMANALEELFNSGTATYDNVYDMLGDHIDFNSNGVKNKVATILSEYRNTEATETEFERTIDRSDVEIINGGNGYKITYEGTITGPIGTDIVSIAPPNNPEDFGVGFDLDVDVSQVPGSADREVVPYTLIITATDARSVVIPSPDEERLVSLQITIEGGATLDSAMIAEPRNTPGQFQRMIVFKLDTPIIYLYFSIAPNECLDIPALDPANCSGESSCSVNIDLFKASGCCTYLLNEESYLYQEACTNECTASTLSSICAYTTTPGYSDLYRIKEGAKYIDSNFEDRIGTCVVNLGDRFDTSASRDDAFYKEDDAGNSITVPEYDDNEICRVTCSEDWIITMEAFGNYVGENAVAAGSYFQIVDEDIFISGKRTCYTSYIDYDQYKRTITVLSQGILDAYITYSDASHDYSDYKKQDDEGTKEVNWTPSTGCINWSEGYDCDGSGEGTQVCYDCLEEDTKYIPSIETNGEFAGGGDPEGQHDEYAGCGTIGCTANPDTSSYAHDVETGICTMSGGDAPTPATWSGSECYDDQDDESAWSVLYDRAQSRLEGVMNGARGTMASNTARIQKLMDYMYDCQHFQLFNNSDLTGSGKAATRPLVGKYAGESSTKDFLKIYSYFDPAASYLYDEDQYMTILGSDNVLEEFTEKNDAVYGGEGAYASATNASEPTNININDEDGITEVQLSRNQLQLNYYDGISSPWVSDSEEGKKYHTDSNTQSTEDESIANTVGTAPGNYETTDIALCTITGEGGGGVGTVVSSINAKGILTISVSGGGGSPTPEWLGGGCFIIKVPNLQANYIKSSIENSSFYKNKGYWYVRNSDVKEHGDNLKDALNKANNRNNSNNYNINDTQELYRWSIIGSYNVFPVGITTPRNLYQYTYTFGQIGSYDNGDLGRLMGTDRSLIQNNKRTCFYEVYEELCLCCGDKINTHVDDDDYLVDEFISSMYDPYSPSSPDNMPGDASLSIATSSVSLSNVTSEGSGRGVAKNLTPNSPFVYNGVNGLTTNKGEELVKEIETKGEKIYSAEPEYSYYLTPSTLSAIREYNDDHGYEINYNELKVYGKNSIAPMNSCASNVSSCEWDLVTSSLDEEDKDKVINFQHYGSLFLEEYMEEYASDSTITRRKSSDNICHVEEGFDSGSLDLSSATYSKCRWIDFIEKSNSYTDPLTEATTANMPFRLAFK